MTKHDGETCIEPSLPTLPTLAGSELSHAQRLFAERLAVLGKKSAAYRESHPGVRRSTARTEGARLARDPRIIRYIKSIRDVGAADASAQVSDLLRQLTRIAFFDVRRAYYPASHPRAGELCDPQDLPEDVACVVTQYEVVEGKFRKRGIRVPDRNAALRTLAEMRGALKNLKPPAPPTSFHFHAAPADGRPLPQARALGKPVGKEPAKLAGYPQQRGAGAADFYRDARERAIDVAQLPVEPLSAKGTEPQSS